MKNKKLCPSPRALLATALLGSIALSAQADVAVLPGDPGAVLYRGRIATPLEVIDGEMLVEGDTITCVAQDCLEPENATRVIVTDAFLVPGLIDAHNHIAYNVLPRWTPTRQYKNRNQWQGDKAYKAFKAPYDRMKGKPFQLLCEMVKYGEAKALVSGVTTIQGSPSTQGCFRTLIRNAENASDLPVTSEHVRTYILDVERAPEIDWRITKSFVVHVAEGLDERSRQEFDDLKAKGLLQPGTAIIHGTAFGPVEFQQMAEAGSKLIWSPQSNLALYRATTRIDQALAAGVPVSIGVDWNLSGSDTIFGELRVAAQVNREQYGGVIPDSGWLPMITVNPADALGLGAFIGRLAPGKKADITVLRMHAPEVGRSLLLTNVQDVQAVWVGGKVLYGDEATVEALRPGQCDPLLVRGASMRMCIKAGGFSAKDTKRYRLDQSLDELMQRLQAAYPGLAPLAP